MKGVDRDTFIEENMGLVGMVVRKYLNRIKNYAHIDWEDFRQIGTLGLINAYDRFDPDYGVQFSTYAVPMIEGEITRYLRDSLDTIKFSRRVKSNYYKIVKADLLNESPVAISILLEIPVEQVEDALAYYRGQYTDSLERPIFEDEGNPMFLGDMIGDETDFDSNLEVKDFLEQFNKRTQKVIKLRLQGFSQKETGEFLGVSQAQISRMLIAAKKQLKRGGISVSKNKKKDFALAKKLAIETDLNGYEIAEKSGISIGTAYNYIKEYRITKEKIEEVESRVKKEESPVKTYKLSPEELEKYREGGPVAKAINDEPKADIQDVVEEINKSPKEVSKENSKLSIEHRIDIPKEAISGLKGSPADGFMTMTFNLTTENATSQLEDIVSAMNTLGFKDLNITIESQQIA